MTEPTVTASGIVLPDLEERRQRNRRWLQDYYQPPPIVVEGEFGERLRLTIRENDVNDICHMILDADNSLMSQEQGDFGPHAGTYRMLRAIHRHDLIYRNNYDQYVQREWQQLIEAYKQSMRTWTFSNYIPGVIAHSDMAGQQWWLYERVTQSTDEERVFYIETGQTFLEAERRLVIYENRQGVRDRYQNYYDRYKRYLVESFNKTINLALHGEIEFEDVPDYHFNPRWYEYEPRYVRGARDMYVHHEMGNAPYNVGFWRNDGRTRW